MSGFSKMDIFLEKVQTAFDPPFFLEFFIALFSAKVRKYALIFPPNNQVGDWTKHFSPELARE